MILSRFSLAIDLDYTETLYCFLLPVEAGRMVVVTARRGFAKASPHLSHGPSPQERGERKGGK
jgi:hypothetical protein